MSSNRYNISDRGTDGSTDIGEVIAIQRINLQWPEEIERKISQDLSLWSSHTSL